MNRPHLNSQEAKSLWRPTGALHVWSDVFPNGRIRDVDAELTTAYRNLLTPPPSTFIGFDEAAYGGELVANLVDAAQAEIEAGIRRAAEYEERPHRNIRRARQWFNHNAIRVILNRAPRNGQGNGSDFYLAITDNGVEIYATPLDVLRYVRHRVTSLFRIPTKGHPLFNGDLEQFRSSIISRSCEVPHHLVRASVNEIPDQEEELEFAFADKFGNSRLRARNSGRVWAEIQKQREKGYVEVQIRDQKERAFVTDSLRHVPPGQLGIYRNVGDGERLNGEPGYLELNVRWAQGGGADSVQSAWETFGRPDLGTTVHILTPQGIIEESRPVCQGSPLGGGMEWTGNAIG